MNSDQDKHHISSGNFALKYVNGELEDANVEVIDVREPMEWEMIHLEDCKHIPLGSLPERLEEIDANKTIYLLCAHGIRSLHAANFLLRQGYADVVNVDGGLAEVLLYIEQKEE
ncbi:rhodanese-like domain-containing protein [Laceyella putida]|uniref:Rhodanese-like domain-containing protein n=2 Tax=Laceyella putida TaxID=110101 RepID=A0ABW2RN14_9BACL